MAPKKPRFAPDQLVVCIESFASSQDWGHCGAGTRLRGDHKTVLGWPQFFMDANTPDDEIHIARTRLWEGAGAGPPQT